MVDPAIKYGGGEEYLKEFLATASAGIAEQENNEVQVLEMQQKMAIMLSMDNLTEELRFDIMSVQEKLDNLRMNLGATRQKHLKVFGETVQFVEKTFRNK